MEVKFTVKIKEKFNPPTFNEKEGVGVVATHVFNIEENLIKKLTPDFLQKEIERVSNQLLNEYFEVTHEKK